MTCFGFFGWLLPGSSEVSTKTACVNKGRRFSSKSPSLARVVEKVLSKKTDETLFEFALKLGNSLLIWWWPYLGAAGLPGQRPQDHLDATDPGPGPRPRHAHRQGLCAVGAAHTFQTFRFELTFSTSAVNFFLRFSLWNLCCRFF